jgi:hypothetical protein
VAQQGVICLPEVAVTVCIGVAAAVDTIEVVSASIFPRSEERSLLLSRMLTLRAYY